MFILLYSFVRASPVDLPLTVSGEQTQISETVPVASPPARLSIASLGIDTTIKPVGLTADNDMAIDDDQDTVAWYQFGPKPGQVGSAVIAGHYGWKDGRGSVFNTINTLKIGDEISVEDEAGMSFTFIVRETRTYNPEADATAVFKSTDAKAHLNLISCIGTWVDSADTYSERIVVFTNLKD